MHSLSKLGKHEISGIIEVNDAAIDDSSFVNEIPTSAAHNAILSFAPSPHMQTVKFSSFNDKIKLPFCSGSIPA